MAEAFVSLGKLLNFSAPSTRSPMGATWVPPPTSVGSARRRAQAQLSSVAGASSLAQHQLDKDLTLPGTGGSRTPPPSDPMDCESPLDPLHLVSLLKTSDRAGGDDSWRDSADGTDGAPSEATEPREADEPSELSEREARKLRKKEVKAARRAKREGMVRLKPCDLCQRETDLLVRCTVDESLRWVMVCGRCWRDVSGGVVDGDASHPHYRYGGLWKAQ